MNKNYETATEQTPNPAAEEWAVLTEVEKQDGRPAYLDVSKLDFDSVKETYTKIADPSKAISAEVSTETQEVGTVFTREDGSTYVETVNTAHPGDFIVTGAKGENYVLTADKVAEMYEPLTDENGDVVEGKYLPKNIVKAVENPTGQEIEIDAPWGGKQNGEADCVIVESQISGERYIIEKEAFEATYRLAEEQ